MKTIYNVVPKINSKTDDQKNEQIRSNCRPYQLLFCYRYVFVPAVVLCYQRFVLEFWRITSLKKIMRNADLYNVIINRQTKFLFPQPSVTLTDCCYPVYALWFELLQKIKIIWVSNISILIANDEEYSKIVSCTLYFISKFFIFISKMSSNYFSNIKKRSKRRKKFKQNS